MYFFAAQKCDLPSSWKNIHCDEGISEAHENAVCPPYLVMTAYVVMADRIKEVLNLYQLGNPLFDGISGL